MDRGRRMLYAVPLIAILAAACVVSERTATASLLPAERGVESLEGPVDRVPANPAYHELLGIAMARQAQSPRQADRALAHIRQALALRPVSPYAWAALAEALYLAGVADETFEVALQRAAQLGPNEPAVQEMVALYGLAVLDEMKPQTHAAIQRMVDAGMRRDAPGMMRIAERRGRLDAACRHVGATSRMDGNRAQLCKNTGAK